MKTQIYLLVNKKGTGKAFNKYYPTTEADEVVVTINLDLPDTLFTVPSLIASVKVDPKDVEPVEITSEVIGNIQRSIEESGLSVTVALAKPESEKESNAV